MLARSIALLVVAALGCGGPERVVRRPGTLSARAPSTAARPECGPTSAPRLCALASVDAEAGAIEVTLRIDPDALPAERRQVRLTFPAETLGPRYAEERVTALEGPRFPVSLGAASEPITLRYRVLLDGSAPAREGRSWRRPGGWHLRGASFLPQVIVDDRVADVPATLELDTGAEPLLTAAGDDRRLFDASSVRRLAEETYEVGSLAVVRRDAGGTVLWVATSIDEPALASVADVLARGVQSLARVLGPPPTESALVVIHPSGEPAFDERLGASVVCATGSPRDPVYESADTLRHLARLWIPGTHALAEPWLEEGLTDYLAVTTMAELTGAPRSSIAGVVLRRHRAGERAPRDLGLAAAFCLDTHLEEGHGSLGAVLRTTLGRDDDEALGAEALIEDLAAVSPASASYLAALLESGEGFAIDDCLERAGLDAHEVSFEGWSDRALAVDVLGIEELRPVLDAQAFVVESADEGSLLAAGDVVIEADGAPVAGLDDLAWALRDAHAGDHVAIAARRGGERRTIEIVVPDLAPDAREQRVHLELAPLEPER